MSRFDLETSNEFERNPRPLQFEQYRDFVDGGVGLQKVGITDENTYNRMLENPARVLFAPLKRYGNGFIVPLVSKISDMPSFNTKVIDGEFGYINVPYDLLERKDIDTIKSSGFADEYYVEETVELNNFELNKLVKSRIQKKIGKLVSPISNQTKSEEHQPSSYQVLTRYYLPDKKDAFSNKLEVEVEPNGLQIINLHNASSEDIEQAHALLNEVMAQESEDFAYVGQISNEELETIINDDSYIALAAKDKGRINSVALTALNFEALDWLKTDRIRNHFDSEGYEAAPHIVASRPGTGKSYSGRLFKESIAIGAKRAAIEGKKYLGMCYECSPKSIFFTPLIMDRAMSASGLIKSDVYVEQTCLVRI